MKKVLGAFLIYLVFVVLCASSHAYVFGVPFLRCLEYDALIGLGLAVAVWLLAVAFAMLIE